MKKCAIVLILAMILAMMAGCSAPGREGGQIAATTLPVYDFTQRLCEGTGLTVTRLVTEQVSCLHDYSLNVNQVKASEAAETIVISGAGLEDFLGDILQEDKVIDASAGIELLESHHHHHDEAEQEPHDHEHDPHLWLSPVHAGTMARNICAGLTQAYPQHQQALEANLNALLADLDELQAYGEAQLAELGCRELVTFHDGFAYFAQAFDLTILEAMEEESGSEASAQELTGLIDLVKEHQLPAVFTEKNGSDSAASVISSETGAEVFALDMAMSGDSYFDSMYYNIDTLKEALG